MEEGTARGQARIRRLDAFMFQEFGRLDIPKAFVKHGQDYTPFTGCGNFYRVEPVPPGCLTVSREKVGRNDPCPCGSGKKFKKCCGR